LPRGQGSHRDGCQQCHQCQRRQANRIRNGHEVIAIEQRAKRIGVDLDARRAVFESAECRVERRSVAIIDLVVGAEQHDLSADPLTDLVLFSGPSRIDEIGKGNEWKRLRWPGVVNGDGPGGGYGNRPAAPRQPSILDLRVDSTELFGHAKRQAAAEFLPCRLFDQNLIADEVVRIGCQIGEGVVIVGRRQDVHLHRPIHRSAIHGGDVRADSRHPVHGGDNSLRHQPVVILLPFDYRDGEDPVEA
jgi:hypothetical protein